MTTVFEALSNQLREIDFRINDADVSHATLESLFQVSFRDAPAVPRPALSPRLCEEHLTTALVASRQAIDARQAFFEAGDKFATLTLSLSGDTRAAALLASEAEAMSLRREISNTAVNAERTTSEAVNAYSAQMSLFVQSVDPFAALPQGDAFRSKWLSYVSRSANHGFDNMAAFWGVTVQTDQSPAGTVPPFAMSPTTPIVDLESELARRETMATFRVTHDRALLEQKASETAVLAARGRQEVLRATAAFDTAAASLAQNRSLAAAALLQDKLAMTRDLSLLDFKGQMELHRRRAQDLFLEATERAEAARTGLQTVYGLALPNMPAATLETAEDLLAWCRDISRLLVGFDPGVVKQTVTLSVRDTAGGNWRQSIGQGITLPAQFLHDLGAVVRLRNLGARFTGTPRSGLVVKAATPGAAADRDVQGGERNVQQPISEIRLVATPAADEDFSGRRTAARVVHNLCPSGTWILQANGVGNTVEDILLDLDISYLVGLAS